MALKEVFHLLLTLGIPVIITWIVIWIIKIVNEELDKRRREQHPEYFEYFDAAMDISKEVHEQTERKTKYFKHRYNVIYEGLRDGECTVEYFQKYLDRVNKEYIEFATWFEAQNKEAKELFRKADFYAKDHDLMWGILY